MRYPALFENVDHGKILVTFPDIDAVSQGDDEQDAMEMGRDALITLIAHHIKHGEPVPAPSNPRGRKYRMIELPPLVGLKTQLYMAFKASAITKAELAKRLGIPKTNVDRLFDFKNKTRLENLVEAFSALGKTVAIEIRDAA